MLVFFLLYFLLQGPVTKAIAARGHAARHNVNLATGSFENKKKGKKRNRWKRDGPIVCDEIG